MSKLFIIIVIVVFTFNSLAQAPKSAQDFNSRGFARFEKGDYDGAIADFTQVIDLTSSLDAKHRPTPAGLSAFQASFDDAWKGVKVINPATAIAYANRGNAFLRKSDFDKAIGDFSLSLSISPGVASVYVCRGTALLLRRDLDRAFADFEKAVKLDPRFVRAYLGMGLVRLDQGDKEAAFEYFDHAIKLEPKNALVYFRRGDARTLTGDIEGALADFEYALKLDPKSADAYLGRGIVRLNKMDLDAAINDFTTSLSLDKFEAPAYEYRGFVYLIQNKTADSEKDLCRAMALAPHLQAEIDAKVKLIKGWPGKNH